MSTCKIMKEYLDLQYLNFPVTKNCQFSAVANFFFFLIQLYSLTKELTSVMKTEYPTCNLKLKLTETHQLCSVCGKLCPIHLSPQPGFFFLFFPVLKSSSNYQSSWKKQCLSYSFILLCFGFLFLFPLTLFLCCSCLSLSFLFKDVLLQLTLQLVWSAFECCLHSMKIFDFLFFIFF